MRLPGRVLLVILGIACVVSGCHGTPTATCFQPSVRPSRVLIPDHYGEVAHRGSPFQRSDRPDSTRRTSTAVGLLCVDHIASPSPHDLAALRVSADRGD